MRRSVTNHNIKFFKTESKMASNKGVSVEILTKLKADFTSDKKNLLAQNVCSKYDTLDVCLSSRAVEGNPHIYNCKV
jgi:hypothetical protein